MQFFSFKRDCKASFSSFLIQKLFEKVMLEKLFQDMYISDLITCFNKEKFAFSSYGNAKKILG